ncbi:MAG: hypothetical protein HY867_17265 [Chloroflexi bacterium]|nr:hypothetical protein [Chloroflexota bacterium]
MKTLGRILIILAVTALVTTALYLAVDTGRAINFSGDDPRNASPGPDAGDGPNEQFRPAHDEGRERGGDGIWVTGMIMGGIKNTVIVGFIVAILVLPKALAKQKRIATAKNGNQNSA